MATTSTPTSGPVSHAGGADVLLVGHRQHAGHQQHGADHLIDEAAGQRQERLRIGGEDAGGRRGALNHAGAAVERRERLAIVEEDDGRRRKRAGDLRQRVRQHLAPRERAMHREGHGHRRIQVRARDAAGGVDAEHHGQAPADVDGQVRPVGLLAEHRLGDDADAEGDEDEGAEELRRGFPRCAFEHARDSNPCVSFVSFAYSLISLTSRAAR